MQRLIDARRDGEGASATAGPTVEQIREGTQMFMEDPDSAAIMAAMSTRDPEGEMVALGVLGRGRRVDKQDRRPLLLIEDAADAAHR